jgi:DNA gyrase subunit A
MATDKGTVKRTDLSAFSNPRKGGIIAITLDKSERLIAAELVDENAQIVLATYRGMSIRFLVSQLRTMGRNAHGVRGIALEKKGRVVSMECITGEGELLTITERGYGKRTRISEYRLQSRAGKGIINIKVTDRIGCVVGVLNVTDGDEILLVTQGGMIIRLNVDGIRVTGRSTQGVKLINLDKDDKIVSIAKVVAKDED